MSKSREKRKKGLIEYLTQKTSLPSDALVNDTRIELRGRNLIFVSGCRRIKKYTPDMIVLSVKCDAVSVCGEGLVCTSYHSGTVSIEGEIHSVSYGEAEE